MPTMYIREDNRPDYIPEHAIEAFYDICQAAKFYLFDDITLDLTSNKPTLTYTVTASGAQLIKEFNPETIKTDLIVYLFSMLDASANL